MVAPRRAGSSAITEVPPELPWIPDFGLLFKHA